MGLERIEILALGITLKLHIKDVKNEIDLLVENYPDKDYFYWGEHGRCHCFKFGSESSSLNINGIILVAPAIWNFTEETFLKANFWV